MVLHMEMWWDEDTLILSMHPFAGCFWKLDPYTGTQRDYHDYLAFSPEVQPQESYTRLHNLGVWSQLKCHLSKQYEKQYILASHQASAEREGIAWAPLLSQSLFNLSRSTQTFMQENKSHFIFRMISLIPTQVIFYFEQCLENFFTQKGRDWKAEATALVRVQLQFTAPFWKRVLQFYPFSPED